MPETTEPGFRKWKIENSMIMSWLINSMNNDIGENFLLFGTAKTYGMQPKKLTQCSENTSELFRLNQPYMTSAKESSHNIQANCGTKETVQVLPRTNRELNDVRGRIMGIKPLPSLREAFLEVRREEIVVEIVRNRDRPGVIIVRNQAIIRRLAGSFMAKPADWKPKPTSDKDETIKPSWQWQYLPGYLTASRGGMKPWIVDTGASDHMTGDAAIPSKLQAK
ncbi:hypothetical protein CK203_095482 [Vitis vinifera]|uniref:Uncharacterized protein n=1 Tax=Vitis vinifera TaxID=29760 RepID=A0A438EIY0_VITVI|nr:hypothetical protein CK203_095482 [Vitis vinifera]